MLGLPLPSSCRACPKSDGAGDPTEGGSATSTTGGDLKDVIS